VSLRAKTIQNAGRRWQRHKIVEETKKQKERKRDERREKDEKWKNRSRDRKRSGKARIHVALRTIANT
jgi:hypothetical protein